MARQPSPRLHTAILIRFYDDVESLRTSLADFQSIDLAWTGLPLHRIQPPCRIRT